MNHTRLAIKVASVLVTILNSLVKSVQNFFITYIICVVLICMLLTIISRDFFQLQFKIQYYFFGNIIYE